MLKLAPRLIGQAQSAEAPIVVPTRERPRARPRIRVTAESLLARRIRAYGVRVTESRAVFDLSTESPRLFKSLTKRSPRVAESLGTLRKIIPLPTCTSKLSAPFYRLPFHNRSICYALQPTKIDQMLGSDVLVFKGAEPMLADFRKSIQWMSETPFVRSFEDREDQSTPDTIGNHFPLREAKVPGTVTASEAREEASKALRIQARHLDVYGELAPLPLPLLIHEISPRYVAKTQSVLEAYLPPRAADKSKALMKDGIATYVYYFPVAPLRVGDCKHHAVQAMLDKQQVDMPPTTELVRRWMRLFVRILYLEHFPYTARNARLGCCFDPGNATVLNGGCCDLDSLLPFEESPNLSFRLNSISTSLCGLADLVDSVLATEIRGQVFSTQRTAYFHRLLEACVESEARPGAALNRDARDMLLADSFPRLSALATTYREESSRVRLFR